MDSEETVGEQSIYKSVWNAMHPGKPTAVVGLSKLRDDMVAFRDCRSKFKAKFEAMCLQSNL